MPIVIHKSQFKAAQAEPPREEPPPQKFAGVVIRKPLQKTAKPPPPRGTPPAVKAIRQPPREEPPPQKFAGVVIRKAAKGGPKAIDVDDARGRYEIRAVIGEGGTGRVVRAFDKMLDMEVAIKILSPRLIRDKEALAALKAEVRITLGLIHKHILRIYNLEKSGDNYLVIMEYLKGKSVAQLLDEAPGGLPADFVVPLVEVASDALGYAHRHGVLHLDLTPGNVFVTDDGVVKIIDFGIAKVAGAQAANSEFIVGTPVYMSPEQLRGEALDARSDIYSMGVLTYQMLTGRLVSPPDTPLETLAFQPHPPLEGLAPAVAETLEAATAFSPDARPAAIGDFAAALADAVGRT